MKVQCELCPKQCLIGQSQSGDCRVRINVDGVLRTVVYGYPCSIHIDPVEKKPVFHFLPGTTILSLATVGCNMHCLNCQNWEISQANPEDSEAFFCPPEKLVQLAKENQCPSIAFTYTDPVIQKTIQTARRGQIVNNLIVFPSATPYTLEAFGMNGKTVLKRSATAMTVDLSRLELPGSVYLVKVAAAGKTWSEKVLIGK